MLENRYIKSVIDYTKKYYENDIDCIVAYGSFVRGEMHEHSDIDLFYIPATDRGYVANFQVIINEIGYDFFPISWERLTAIADYRDPLTSLLLEGVVVYHRNDEVFNHFEKRRMECVHFDKFNDLIPGLIKEMKYLYFDYPATLPDILTKAAMAVAYYNHQPLRRGMMDFENELKDFEKPILFIENIKLAIESPSKLFIHKLIIDVENFTCNKNNSVTTLYPGFYEELKSIYQKGHETTSVYKQFFLRHIIEKETENYFKNSISFPKQTGHFSDWLDNHEELVKTTLVNENIHIHEYQSLDDFITFYLKT